MEKITVGNISIEYEIHNLIQQKKIEYKKKEVIIWEKDFTIY